MVSMCVLVSDQSWEARASTRPAEFEQASGRRRVRDHRGEIRLRRDLAVDQRFARELAHGRALLDELELEPAQYAGFDRSPAFRLGARPEIAGLDRKSVGVGKRVSIRGRRGD